MPDPARVILLLPEMSAATLGVAPIPNAVRTPGVPSELRQPPVAGGLMLPQGQGPLAEDPSPKQNWEIWLQAGLVVKVTRTRRTPRTRISFMGF